MEKFKFLFGVLLGLWGMNGAFAASCYPESMKQSVPAVLQTAVVLIDETTPRDSHSEKVFRENVTSLLEGQAKKVAILAFAGNAPGQSLRVLGQWTIEDFLTDEDVVNNTIIAVYRKSQACVKKNRALAKAEGQKVLDAAFGSMPIVGERSEIAFAVASAIKDFARPGQSLLVLTYSDGLQFSKGTSGRSFYAGTGQGMPRKLDAKMEMGLAAKDPLTAPRKIDGAFVSVVWHGMLALPAPKGKEKPIYVDTGVIGSFVEFWTSFLRSQGVEKIQIGTPVLNNVDLSLPSALNPK